MNLLPQALEAALKKRKEAGLLRQRTIETKRAAGDFTDLASNDYLNLSQHSFLKERANNWIEKYGVGSTGSRLISGSYEGYSEVEQKFAHFKKTENALLFNSGWQANASILPALNALSVQTCSKPAIFFMDKLCHASMIQGANACQTGLSKAKILRFRHNDMAHLEHLLQKEKHTQGLKFILTETIFSMDGDRADLETLTTLKKHYQAALYVDEAHATGIFGKNGAGLASPQETDLILSTGSKALGSAGAFLCASNAMCEFLWNMASGFVYSTALPPPVLGALEAAIELLPHLEKERQYIQHLAEILRHLLQKQGWNCLGSDSQIVPLLVGKPEDALRLQDKLRQAGFRCGAIRPPTVPPNTARLRFTLHTEICENDLYHIADILGSP